MRTGECGEEEDGGDVRSDIRSKRLASRCSRSNSSGSDRFIPCGLGELLLIIIVSAIVGEVGVAVGARE